MSKIPSLKDLSDPDTLDIIVRNPDHNAWRSVQINSNKWYEAHEVYPESALNICNLQKSQLDDRQPCACVQWYSIGTMLFSANKIVNG